MDNPNFSEAEDGLERKWLERRQHRLSLRSAAQLDES